MAAHPATEVVGWYSVSFLQDVIFFSILGDEI